MLILFNVDEKVNVADANVFATDVVVPEYEMSVVLVFKFDTDVFKDETDVFNVETDEFKFVILVFKSLDTFDKY